MGVELNTRSDSRLAGQQMPLWSGVMGIAFLTLVYVCLVNLTKPISWGDTGIYASDIAAFSEGQVSSRRIWEFGHLFWRPIGNFLWHLGGASWPPRFGGDKVLQISAALQLPNLVLGYFGGLAAFGIAWRISRNAITATAIATAFLGWNATLNYSQSGTAYVPGLTMELAGLYLLLGFSRHGFSPFRAWLAGVALAVSVCLWFPYLFGLPGIFLLAYLWDRKDTAWNSVESRTRLRWLAHALAACALVGTASYAAGMWSAGIRSAGELKAWVLDAGHGYQPDKRYLRVVTGLPRGLVQTGEDGLMLKRFATRDPYAPVGAFDLLFTGVWKILLFYVGLAALIWTLLRDKDARPVRLAFLLSGGLLVFFAVVVFEPGQSERWMPLFAVLLAAVAFVFRSRETLRLSALPLAAMLAVVWVSNVAAHATRGEPGPDSPAVARVDQLMPLVAPNSTVCLLSFRDEISLLGVRFPFHAVNRNEKMKFYVIVEPGNMSTAVWERDFASRGLLAWRRNGEFWISKRMTAKRPAASWGWTEADDPHLKWRDLPAFFEGFAFDGESGGPDGFLRIARNPANQARLEAAAQGSSGRAL